jgi:hypothetical protein
MLVRRNRRGGHGVARMQPCDGAGMSNSDFIDTFLGFATVLQDAELTRAAGELEKVWDAYA